jgi:hypothetical protein
VWQSVICSNVEWSLYLEETRIEPDQHIRDAAQEKVRETDFRPGFDWSPDYQRIYRTSSGKYWFSRRRIVSNPLVEDALDLSVRV